MDRFDIVALIGLALLAAGLYFVYWPLALIVPGVVLFGVGALGARRKGEGVGHSK